MSKPSKPLTQMTLPELIAHYTAEEPMKRRRQPDKSLRLEADWSLNSRLLMLACLFGPCGERAPRGRKDKLPSIDADALERMSHPIAGQLLRWRSATKTLASIKGAEAFIHPNGFFRCGRESATGTKATILFRTLGLDNVERVFTSAKRSIPLNLDKRGRDAFVAVPCERDALTLADVTRPDARNALLLAQLVWAPPADVALPDEVVQ